jgi:transposase
VGKKNWLFIGDAEACERSAIVSTVIESCRRRGIDPLAYLRDGLTRMPQMAVKDYATLAPAAWAKAHRPAKPGRKDRLRTKASDLQRRCA